MTNCTATERYRSHEMLGTGRRKDTWTWYCHWTMSYTLHHIAKARLKRP